MLFNYIESSNNSKFNISVRVAHCAVRNIINGLVPGSCPCGDNSEYYNKSEYSDNKKNTTTAYFWNVAFKAKIFN